MAVQIYAAPPFQCAPRSPRLAPLLLGLWADANFAKRFAAMPLDSPPPPPPAVASTKAGAPEVRAAIKPTPFKRIMVQLNGAPLNRHH